MQATAPNTAITTPPASPAPTPTAAPLDAVEVGCNVVVVAPALEVVLVALFDAEDDRDDVAEAAGLLWVIVLVLLLFLGGWMDGWMDGWRR